MKQMADELRQAAHIDGLTGVYNRRKFDEAINIEWLRAQRIGQSLALIMMDIDHFKAYNDHNGHLAGDQCLKNVATALKSAIKRPSDLLARYGGEEFVLLLPGTGITGAMAITQQIRHAIDELKLPHGNSPLHQYITLSMGVSAIESGADPEMSHRHESSPIATVCRLISAADQALYKAKNAGRAQTRFLAVDSPEAFPTPPHVPTTIPQNPSVQE
mgnify:FL=1